MAVIERFARKLRRAILRDEPTYYDMFQNPGERYFAKLYLHQIEEVLRTHPAVLLKILDAGCQAGRLAIPLAQAGHEVTGVDTSGVGLSRATRHAKEAKIPLRLIRADLGAWLPAQPAGSFDAVICTEVLYLRENHRELLEGLLRVLKPEGFCFISHRSRGYYLAEAFQHRDWNAVRLLSSAQEGILFGSYYNWQDREELERIYRALKIRLVDIRPIGLFSWLAVQPGNFDEEGRELLFSVESKLSSDYAGAARYLLVSGQKESA